MREDLLKELENEYAVRRASDEREEAFRRERIRSSYPQIESLAAERENMIFSTIRRMLDGLDETEELTGKMENLNRRIGTMLKEAGFSEDYLSPVYSCPKCRDTGYCGETVKKPCECMLKAYQQKLRERIGLCGDKEETFENYNAEIIPDEKVGGTGVTQRQLTEIAREQCEKWANQYPLVNCRDILLTGGSGLGKTFLMRAMASRLIERGKNVLIISAYSFLQIARRSYFDSEDSIRELMDAQVLMLDDLGSEPLMQNVTIEQLFQLINVRQSRGLSTVISTNLNLQELRERYTERIASRLNNPKNCMILTLAGRDLRKFER